MKALMLGILAAALPNAAMAETPAAETPETRIVFFRTATLAGAGLACPVRYNDTEIVELGRGKFAELAVKPGRYMFANRSSGIEVNIAMGETRYVRCRQNNFSAELQLVDEATYNRYLKDMKRKEMAVTAL